jgi:DNA transposition AAA+ family ATPase
MRGWAALAELWENKQTSNTNLCLVDGKTGYGKTEFLETYATQHPGRARYLRCLDAWSVPWMLRDICRALGLPPRGTTENNLRQLIAELKERPRIVILDDAQERLIARRHHLNTIRDLHDETKTPIVMVGEGKAQEEVFRKSPSSWRRVSQVVVFQALSVADIQVMAQALCEPGLEIPAALAERIRQESLGGSFGEVVVNLAKVEKAFNANQGKLTEKVVEMALKTRKGA